MAVIQKLVAYLFKITSILEDYLLKKKSISIFALSTLSEP